MVRDALPKVLGSQVIQIIERLQPLCRDKPQGRAVSRLRVPHAVFGVEHEGIRNGFNRVERRRMKVPAIGKTAVYEHTVCGLGPNEQAQRQASRSEAKAGLSAGAPGWASSLRIHVEPWLP